MSKPIVLREDCLPMSGITMATELADCKKAIKLIRDDYRRVCRLNAEKQAQVEQLREVIGSFLDSSEEGQSGSDDAHMVNQFQGIFRAALEVTKPEKG